MERRTNTKKETFAGRRITDTVSMTVNHKLIADEIKEHIGAFKQDFDEYVRGDMEWKKRAEPVVKAFENTNWAFRIFIGAIKVTGYAAAAIVSVVGALAILRRYTH